MIVVLNSFRMKRRELINFMSKKQLLVLTFQGKDKHFKIHHVFEGM
jgi:hypothetical protein